jgi:hypothetical protein
LSERAGSSGALHTDRAVDLVLKMLVGPVVDRAQLTLLDRRAHRFRAVPRADPAAPATAVRCRVRHLLPRARFGDDRMRAVLLETGPCDVRAHVESVAVVLSRHLADRPRDDIGPVLRDAVAAALRGLPVSSRLLAAAEPV